MTEQQIEEKPIKRFSDFHKKVEFEGQKVDIVNLIDKEITVLNFELLPSTQSEGEFAVVQASYEGEKIQFTGSGIMADQLKKVGKPNLPFITTIKKERSKLNPKWFYHKFA